MAHIFAMAPQAAMFDTSSRAMTGSFGRDTPGTRSADPRKMDEMHGVAFSTQSNTEIGLREKYLIEQRINEMVFTAPDDPFIGRIAPLRYTKELVVQKKRSHIQRQIVQLRPEMGTSQRVRMKETVITAMQERYGFEIVILESSLISEQGVRILSTLMAGAAENIVVTLRADVINALASASYQSQVENMANGVNTFAPNNTSYASTVSAQNALQQSYDGRVASYAVLTKDTQSFDLLTDTAKELISARGGTADTIVVGPGVQPRISIGKEANMLYYTDGGLNKMVRVEGSRTMTAHQGLAIVKAIPVDPDSGERSLLEREVEVGEFYLMLRNKECGDASTFKGSDSSIKVYNEDTDSYAIKSLGECIRASGFFGPDGKPDPLHRDLAEEYNRTSSTHYKSTFGIVSEKVIEPKEISMFLYKDSAGMAKVAKLLGQLDIFGQSTKELSDLARSAFSVAGLTETRIGALTAGLADGIAFLEELAAKEYSEEEIQEIARDGGNAEAIKIGNRNELSGLTDATGNNLGSLKAPQGATGLGYVNGSGIRQLSSQYVAGDEDFGGEVFERARAFWTTASAVTRMLQRILPSSKMIGESAAWFHMKNPTTTFIDTLAPSSVPAWSKGGNLADGAMVADMSMAIDASGGGGGDDAFLNAVEASLNEPFVKASTKFTKFAVATAGKLASIARVSGRYSDTALNYLQQVLQASNIVFADDKIEKLGLIDARLGVMVSKMPPDLADATMSIVASIAKDSSGDVSPASFRNYKSEDEREERLNALRVAVTYIFHRMPQDNVVASVIKASTNKKAFKKWLQSINAEATGQMAVIIDSLDWSKVTFESRAGVSAGGLVRLPLTLSKSQAAAAAAGNGYVSVENAPWTAVVTTTGNNGGDDDSDDDSDDGGGRVGDKIGEFGSQLHQTPFFRNALTPTRVGGRVKRGRDYEDLGRRVQRRGAQQSDVYAGTTSLQRDQSAQLRRMMRGNGDGGGDDYDYGSRVQVGSMRSRAMDTGAGQAAIGAQYPVSVETRGGGGGGGDQRNDRGEYFHDHFNSAFNKTWDRAGKLTELQRVIIYALLFTTLDEESLVSIAENLDSPVGVILFRPHIRHRMATVIVLQSGPETCFTAYSETKAKWQSDASLGTLSFYPGWYSCCVVLIPGRIVPIFDVAPVGMAAYIGGNGVGFYKKGKIEYNADTPGSKGSFYVALVPANLDPNDLPNPINMTGVYLGTFDNNALLARVPHYPSAPFVCMYWDLGTDANRPTPSGYADIDHNLECWSGHYLTTGITGAHDIKHKNLGHWGETAPGCKNKRSGSDIIEKHRHH
jgi:hypothetical protein